MKTLKYILLGVILSSLVFSSFSFNPSGNNASQSEKVTFCETYTQRELLSKLDRDDPLFTWVKMENTDPESSRIGRCHQDNLEDLWSYIQSEDFHEKVQKDLVIATGAEALDQLISLYAIKMSTSNNLLPLQEEITEVSVSKDGQENNYALLISFSESGAEKWASMTRANLGRDIAILFDGKVISAPRVREEITGGKCSISGKFSKSEINELKAVLDN